MGDKINRTTANNAVFSLPYYVARDEEYCRSGSFGGAVAKWCEKIRL